MRILCVASDIPLSANHGGAVHVREVASGLAELGHAVRVVVKGRTGEPQRGAEHGFEIRRVLRGVPGRRLRLLCLPAVAREIHDFRPDVIIERYYNFGGEGVTGEEGILYPEGDTRALASALSRLIEAPEGARVMGLSARKRAVEHFSWRRHCAALEEILRGIAASCSAGILTHSVSEASGSECC